MIVWKERLLRPGTKYRFITNFKSEGIDGLRATIGKVVDYKDFGGGLALFELDVGLTVNAPLLADEIVDVQDVAKDAAYTVLHPWHGTVNRPLSSGNEGT